MVTMKKRKELRLVFAVILAILSVFGCLIIWAAVVKRAPRASLLSQCTNSVASFRFTCPAGRGFTLIIGRQLDGENPVLRSALLAGSIDLVENGGDRFQQAF